MISTAAITPVVSGQETTNNTTEIDYPLHKDPERIESRDTLDELSSVLGRSVLERYSKSLIDINASKYEQAEELLSGETRKRLDLYIDVSSELDSEEQAETFNATQSSQKRYTDRVSSFDRTHQRYQQARDSGDDDRARRIARNLTTSYQKSLSSSSKLESDFQEIEQVSGYNTSQIRAIIEARETRLNKTYQQAVDNSFVRTNLAVNASAGTVSFTESLQLSGQVETLTGQPVQNQDIIIKVQGQQYPVTLDSQGEFERQIQPAGVWKNKSKGIHVQYVPQESAIYLGNQTVIPVNVTTTATDVSITSVRESISFDTPVVISGVVTTDDGRPVPDAPVAIRTAGVTIGTTRTAPDGKFDFRQPIPSTIPVGDVTLQTGVTASQLALQPSQSEAVTTVELTPSVIELDAKLRTTDNSPPAIQVQGQLSSAGGRPVQTAPITIGINGETVGVVETATDGEFSSATTVPEDVTTEESLTVQARYNTSNTNLESSSARTNISKEVLSAALQQASRATGPQILTQGRLIGLAFVGAVVALITAVWWIRREQPVSDEVSTEQSESTDASKASTRENKQQLIDIAQEKLHNGEHKPAATLAYAAARYQLEPEVANGDSMTHWEWYQACADAGIEQLSQIETLVQSFEYVQFAPDSERTPEAANRAVSSARAVAR